MTISKTTRGYFREYDTLQLYELESGGPHYWEDNFIGDDIVFERKRTDNLTGRPAPGRSPRTESEEMPDVDSVRIPIREISGRRKTENTDQPWWAKLINY